MASGQLLDVKTDADYIALRRRMSRLRVQNNKAGDDIDDDDDDLSDEMLNDLIKYWKKNNIDIAKRFVQQKKERRAKRKGTSTPKPDRRRKSIEFEDLEATRNGLRLKTHEPLHLHKDSTRLASDKPDCTGSDEHLSVRRPKRSSNEQKMSMIVHRVRSKTNMSKAEEKIIKSKLDPVVHSRVDTSNGFRSRTNSGSRVGTPSGFRSRTNSGSSKDLKKKTSELDRPKSSTQFCLKRELKSEEDSFRQRSLSNSSKSPPERRKIHGKLSKQTSMPITSSTT